MPTLDLTEATILAKLGDFLTDVLPAGTPIQQGQVNRIPPPAAPDYVVFWPVHRARLSTNVGAYDPEDATKAAMTPTEFTVQVDVHGERGADLAQVVTALWRDPYGCEFMDPVAAPLFADEPVQMPFWNDQQQTENRWVLKLHMQINPTVSTPQQFADTVTIEIVEVDTTFPPGAP